MITGRKRIYLLIMVLAGVGLAVDRFILSEPLSGPVEAVAAMPRVESSSIVSRETGVPIDSSIPELPFPEKLQSFAPKQILRDVFSPPGEQKQVVETGEPSRIGEGSTRAGDDAQRANASTFASHHAISGVLTKGDTRIAIVDGKWLRVGDRLNGCTLTDIIGNSARFSCSDGDATLSFGP